MPTPAKTKESSSTEPSSGTSHRRLVVFLAVLLTAAAAYGVVQWRERNLRAAEKALAAGEADKAYELVTRFLSERPGHMRAKALLAQTFVAKGQPEAAIQLFDEVGAASAADLHALARAFLMRERWSDAVPMLMQAIQLDPTNADALYELTSARLRLGMSEDALKSAELFAALPGQEARGWVFIGSIHGDRGNYEKAAEGYLRALEYAPDGKDLQVRPDELFLEVGRMLLGAGKAEEAVPHINKSIDSSPSDGAFVSLGVARAELGDLKAAVEAWTHAVTISPSNLDAREYLANERLRESDAEAALKWLKPLETSPLLKASTAYAIQRSYTLLKQTEAAEKWRKKTETMRKQEQLTSAIDNILVDDPNSYWAQIIRAHRFASVGSWEQAQDVLGVIASERDHPFVVELIAAVRDRSALPPIERLPITQF